MLYAVIALGVAVVALFLWVFYLQMERNFLDGHRKWSVYMFEKDKEEINQLRKELYRLHDELRELKKAASPPEVSK